MCLFPSVLFFFFFNDTATTEIYPLSLHDALPICPDSPRSFLLADPSRAGWHRFGMEDRKSTRLNSSHDSISYAVFCLKNNNEEQQRQRVRDDRRPLTGARTLEVVQDDYTHSLLFLEQHRHQQNPPVSPPEALVP